MLYSRKAVLGSYHNLSPSFRPPAPLLLLRSQCRDEVADPHAFKRTQLVARVVSLLAGVIVVVRRNVLEQPDLGSRESGRSAPGLGPLQVALPGRHPVRVDCRRVASCNDVPLIR